MPSRSGMTAEQLAAEAARVARWRNKHPERVRKQRRDSARRRWEKMTSAQRRRHGALGAKWKAMNPERTVASERRYILKQYGLSAGDYSALLMRQRGLCAICGSTDPGVPPNRLGERWFPVDHDHDTGAVRGLLCSTCNSGIGLLKDSPELLLRAHSYLIGAK